MTAPTTAGKTNFHGASPLTGTWVPTVIDWGDGGMRAREAVPHDIVTTGRRCPHCLGDFEDNRAVVEPAGQQFSIHQSCVIAMARSLVDPDEERALRRYDELRLGLACRIRTVLGKGPIAS